MIHDLIKLKGVRCRRRELFPFSASSPSDLCEKIMRKNLL